MFKISTWILLVLLTHHGGADHIEFNSKRSCENALVELKRVWVEKDNKPERWITLHCVPKDILEQEY